MNDADGDPGKRERFQSEWPRLKRQAHFITFPIDYETQRCVSPQPAIKLSASSPTHASIKHSKLEKSLRSSMFFASLLLSERSIKEH